MKKAFLAAFAIALVAVSCEKKEETVTETTVEETTPVTTVDTTSVATTEPTAAVATNTIKYESTDGKTTFNVVYDANAGTAVVTNETTGTVYNMKSAVSGSGARYEDADKNFFQEHQGGFQFGQGETTQVEGKVKN